MSSITWPATLPQHIEKRGYAESPPDSRIRSSNDMGPPKVRRRFSAQVRPFEIVMSMTQEQLDTFDTFWTTTTEGGALAFNFPNPRGAGTIEVRFGDEAPQYGQFRGSQCKVTMSLERLP